MISTGQKLYERWRSEMASQGIDVEEWHELEPADRRAWEKLGDHVDEMVSVAEEEARDSARPEWQA